MNAGSAPQMAGKTPHAAALEAVLLACHFDELTPDVARRLKAAVDAFAVVHRALPWPQREPALRASPCVIWALFIHGEALCSQELPPELVPRQALPDVSVRLPTRKEWFGVWPPPPSGPIPGHHAAVLRFLTARKADGDDGQDPSRLWARMAGWFLHVLGDFLPSDDQVRTGGVLADLTSRLNTEPSTSSSSSSNPAYDMLAPLMDGRRASEPASQRPPRFQMVGGEVKPAAMSDNDIARLMADGIGIKRFA